MDESLRPDVISGLWAVRKAIAIDGGKSFGMEKWYCGTTMCIAGHYGALRGIPYDAMGGVWFTESSRPFIELLERDFHGGVSLTKDDGHAWCRLFYIGEWPGELLAKYVNASLVGERSGMVAAAHEAIDWYIAENATPEAIEAARLMDESPAEVADVCYR